MGGRTLAPPVQWSPIVRRRKAVRARDPGPGREGVVRAKTEDPRRALEAAFREESALLHRWLSKRLGNADDAQDVLQSVYLRILSFGADHQIDNPKALIFRTAANLALNEMKRRNRFNVRHIEPSGEDETDPVLNVRCEAPTVEESLLAREAIEAAAAVVDALPEKARQAFLLNRVEGKTYKEIATALGVSQSSVEKYIIRALSDLRDLQRRQGTNADGPDGRPVGGSGEGKNRT